MTIRGRDRTADRSRNCRTIEDHKAASAKDDRATIDPGDEDWKRMANQQSVSGSVLAKRDGVIR